MATHSDGMSMLGRLMENISFLCRLFTIERTGFVYSLVASNKVYIVVYDCVYVVEVGDEKGFNQQGWQHNLQIGPLCSSI